MTGYDSKRDSDASRALRSPLANARGTGAAHDGVRTWYLERLSSLALVPLTLWFLYCLLSGMVTLDAAGVAQWLANPVPALLMCLFLVICFWHAKLGMRAIMEDYIHAEGAKFACLIVNGLVFNLATLASLFAVFKMHFLTH